MQWTGIILRTEVDVVQVVLGRASHTMANHWHEEVAANSTVGHTSGNNAATQAANANNPTDFMWSGVMKTNSSGDTWSGYEPNWDEGLVLNDIDLTGADRAWMSLEIFRHLGLSDLYVNDGTGFILAEVWDDAAMIEVFSEDVGWVLINCPNSAYFAGQCPSTVSYWGGYDNGRVERSKTLDWTQQFYRYGGAIPGTQYGWANFTEEGPGFLRPIPIHRRSNRRQIQIQVWI